MSSKRASVESCLETGSGLRPTFEVRVKVRVRVKGLGSGLSYGVWVCVAQGQWDGVCQCEGSVSGRALLPSGTREVFTTSSKTREVFTTIPNLSWLYD